MTSSSEDRDVPVREEGHPTLLATSPPGHGILLTLEPVDIPCRDNDNDNAQRKHRSTHRLTLRFVPDETHPHVHPHAKCPDTIPLTTTHLLAGGGSGAAVFSGLDSKLGSIVMKHGGYKDVDELFALATVHRELTLRGRLGKDAAVAAVDLALRIPDFRSVYVSPDHLDERGRDLWTLLRKAVGRWGGKGLRSRAADATAPSPAAVVEASEVVDASTLTCKDCEDEGSSLGAGESWDGSGEELSRTSSGVTLGDDSSSGVHNKLERTRSSLCHRKYADDLTGFRNIRIFSGRRAGKDAKGETSSSVVLNPNHLDIYLDHPDADIECKVAPDSEDGGTIMIVELTGPPNASGYAALRRLSADLRTVLRRRLWKATLAQSTIGGPDSPTASSLHLGGKLWLNDGRLLDTLIDEFIRVVKELRSLTRPEEKDALETVRAEIAELDRRLDQGGKGVGPTNARRLGEESEGKDDRDDQDDKVSPADVSDLANQFVGRAIRKNFHPTDSRFQRLRNFGDRILTGTMILTAEETTPAIILGRMLTRANPVKIGELFELPPGLHSRRTGQDAATTYFFDGVYDGTMDGIGWLRLLRHAASLKGKACTDRIWNAGLADAGLHNQFLDGGKLLLFDLGKPSLEPVPAFLTKFFMSFFHTLGMEEEEEGGGWVRRFRILEEGNGVDVQGGGIPKLALTEETDELLPEVHKSFERTMDRFIDELFDGEVEVRGLIVKYVIFQLVSDAAFCLEKWEIKGGGIDRTGNHNCGLEKWLWRALWDMFMAWHVGTTLIAAGDFVL